MTGMRIDSSPKDLQSLSLGRNPSDCVATQPERGAVTVAVAPELSSREWICRLTICACELGC